VANDRMGRMGRSQSLRRSSKRRATAAALKSSARQLGAAMAMVALIGVVPALMAWPGTNPVVRGELPAWLVMLLLITWLHLAYAVYLAQIPHPASLLVATLFLLVVTSMYAMLAAVRMLVDDRHTWMRFLRLDTNQFAAAQEATWCFLMVLLTGMVAYYAGRLALFWRCDMAPETNRLTQRVRRFDE